MGTHQSRMTECRASTGTDTDFSAPSFHTHLHVSLSLSLSYIHHNYVVYTGEGNTVHAMNTDNALNMILLDHIVGHTVL